MWRQPHTSFPGNEDSDQSISDDNDDDGNIGHDSMVSPSVSLAGTLPQNCQKNKNKKDGSLSSEDEVEFPDFHDNSNIESPTNVDCHSISLQRDGSANNLEVQTSDFEEGNMVINSSRARTTVSETLDLYTSGKQKRYEHYPLSEVDKDSIRSVERGTRSSQFLLQCNDKSPVSGGVGTEKKRLMSHFQPSSKDMLLGVRKEEDFETPSSDESLDDPETMEARPIYNFPSDFREEFERDQIAGSNLALQVVAVCQHDQSRASMAQLLDNLQGQNRRSHFKSEMGGRSKGKNKSGVLLRNVSSSLGNDIMGDEDPCEIMDSGSSADEEGNTQNLELAIVRPSRKTMADKFQEAFGSAPLEDKRCSFTVPKQSNHSGLLGRLQHILQYQKERDSEFLKKLQTEVWPKEEARCLDLKILSRSFEAKMTVCRCCLLEREESSFDNPQHERFGKMWTVIFNPRVCGDVDLEVANFVRIHPPWKEVQVLQGGEIIILATYFTQVYT